MLREHMPSQRQRKTERSQYLVPLNWTILPIVPTRACGPSVDPHLNRQKNIRSLDGEAEPMTIQEMKDLPDPVEDFEVGDMREKLQALGEGKKIVVVANALAVRKGSAESCNCKLTRVADTDNHIVLVDRVLRRCPRFAPWILAARLGRWPEKIADDELKQGRVRRLLASTNVEYKNLIAEDDEAA